MGGNLDLRDIPSAVGGDVTKRHGIILAKSIPAKKYNIKTGESVPEALRKCPDLVLVPPNYKLYQKSSKAFMNILKEYGPTVELYSIDEAFVDMTGTESLFGKTEDISQVVTEETRQLNLFDDMDYEKQERLDRAVDDISKLSRLLVLALIIIFFIINLIHIRHLCKMLYVYSLILFGFYFI
nr:hypothetical protein [Lacrimispora celerecrescens]